MKELEQFTVERLEELSNARMISGHDIADIRALARIALAAKRAEPWGYEVSGKLFNSLFVAGNYASEMQCETLALYTTPPANSPVVPEGWKLLPEEATLAMLTLLGLTGSFESMQERYANMLAAAPEKENG
ncbi:Uncharacterised protein [Yersinia frederiksenii]|nr:Uncharacterised protein [Yersinia frederiksenii]